MLCFNFILGLNFIVLCFGSMVMYGNEFKTKEKIKPQHIPELEFNTFKHI